MPRFLVVDDSRVQRKVIIQVLKELGHEYEEASNGRDCLESIQKAPPDCLLLDLHMPEMNGLEVLENLDVATKSQMVILIVSSSIRADLLQRCKDLGIRHFLKKPYDSSDLKEKLAQILP